MTEQFALENRQRLKAIMNLAAKSNGSVDIAFRPFPKSQYDFTAVLKGPIDDFISGRTLLLQQELFNYFGSFSSIIKANDQNGNLRVVFKPDVVCFNDDPQAMQLALDKIHSDFEDYILDIEFKHPMRRGNSSQPVCV